MVDQICFEARAIVLWAWVHDWLDDERLASDRIHDEIGIYVVALLGRKENIGNFASRCPARNRSDASRNALTKARHPLTKASRAGRVEAKHRASRNGRTFSDDQRGSDGGRAPC